VVEYQRSSWSSPATRMAATAGGPAGRPACCQKGQRAGEPLKDDGVEAGDVDAELEGVGGGHAEELPGRQGLLQLPPLLGR